MRTLLILAPTLGIAVVLGALWTSGRAKSASALPAPLPGAVVLAELFTSEGCSSCPPADELLSRLTRQQPLSGVTVLGMSEHVDYWNDLGWADPFSSADYSRRQSAYLGRIPNSAENTIYTPQMVIDGAAEAVGSDASDVSRKIAQAAARQKAAIRLTTLPSQTGSLQLQINVEIPPEIAATEPADILIAVTEDNLSSAVRRGENSGRHLEHTAVVRHLQNVAMLKAQEREWSGTASITVAPEWKPADLKAIAFLQEQRSRHILGASWTPLPAATQSSPAEPPSS
jgi:hypothetical protein